MSKYSTTESQSQRNPFTQLLAALIITVFASACSTTPPLSESQAAALKASGKKQFDRLSRAVEKQDAQGTSVLASDLFTDATWNLSTLGNVLDDPEELTDLDKMVELVEKPLEDAQKRAATLRPQFQETLAARDECLSAGVKTLPAESTEFVNIDDDLKFITSDFPNHDPEDLKGITARYKQLYVATLQSKYLGTIRQSLGASTVRGAAERSPKQLEKADRALKAAEAAIAKNPKNPKRFAKSISVATSRANDLAQTLR